MSNKTILKNYDENDIAIVGMAAHLPGAGNIDEYWRNLRQGVESIRKLSPDELRDAGVSEALLARPDYVPAAAMLDQFEYFDGDFFGFSPKESAILDPQHRQFLEVAWEAFENAGHPPESVDGPIGVFAGCGMGSYFYFNICSNPELVDDVGMFLLRHTGNDKDFLSTRVSHVFDLKGPSISMQTACSTSLVATHYAAQSLLTGECDMALAGGVTIELPHGHGYVFKEGEVLSPDGACHAFDHRAEGTVFGSGAGAVVLRRMEDALRDGDHIWAVIKGSAVNNDGAAKAGYLAPSVDGQAAAIREALAVSQTPAETIDYVECHGTGTYLGDPIEVAALTEAFAGGSDSEHRCRIGSVKTNIGHLDTAAGVASLIKASLALKNAEMPPSLGYEKPNPAIDFEHSPFVVNDRLTPWSRGSTARRAGVNSLGVGGTNAHVVVEEAPESEGSDASDWPFQIMTVSARSKAALEGNAKALAEHLRENPEQNLADVAFTLKEGRRAFEKRRALVAETPAEAAQLLEENDPRRVFTHQAMDAPDTVFMFPGGGAQYAGMAQDLYETEPVFAEWMDRGFEVLQPRLEYDIKPLWLPAPDEKDAANEMLKRPSVQLPLIMIVEYALAQLWISWGVKPDVLVGHSMGENTAACLAGVMSFEDCIGLVHLRGRLFDTVPAGGMLSVSLPAEELRKHLGETLDLASVNAPGLSVASGPDAELASLQARLEALDIDCQRVAIDIAAHSRMLEPILQGFGDYLRSITLNAPVIPFVSNRTGALISDDQATDPDYWVGHLRGTILFAECVQTLSARENRIYIEMGPGRALSSLAQQCPNIRRDQVISALRHPDDAIADDRWFVSQLGRIWAMGGRFDWAQVWGDARRNRLPLPTYQFQKKPYFIEPGQTRVEQASSHLARIPELENWGFAPFWKPVAADCNVDVVHGLKDAAKECWLFFMDEAGLGKALANTLRNAGHEVVELRAGDAFGRDASGGYVLSPERGREGYDLLVEDLSARSIQPTRIAHFWLVTDEETHRAGSSFFHRNQEQGFYSLLFLAQAMAAADWSEIAISAFTTGAATVRGEALVYPEKSCLRGPIMMIPREMPGLTAAMVDISLPDTKRKGDRFKALLPLLLEELLAAPHNAIAAIRGERRFEEVFKPFNLAVEDTSELPLRQEGTYLITGGFGGIGLTLAEKLVRDYAAKIVLLARTALPPRDEWEAQKLRHGSHDSISRRIAAVEKLEALGGQVMVVAGDVSNIEDMRGTVEQVSLRFGDIHGVIHAAGAINDAPLLSKTMAEIEDVFTPKLHGTEVLGQLFPDGTLDCMVLFSSSSTVTAPVGQVDYVAANEFLNAYAKSRSGGKTKVLALNWGIWAEVGMAADALGLTAQQPDQTRQDLQAPLLQAATFDRAGNRLFTAELTTRHWILNEHRTKQNHALMPGTGYLELAAEALHAQGETAPFELRDLYFLRALEVADDESRELRVTLERDDIGYQFKVQSSRDFDGRQGFETNATGVLVLTDMPQPAPIDFAPIADRCEAFTLAEEGRTLRSPQEEHLNFGPRWRVLKETALGESEGLARLALPKAASGDNCLLHPGIMDLATGWAMELIEGYVASHLWVPVSYGALRVYRDLPEELVSWVQNAAENTVQAGAASFDIVLCDTTGEVCAEIRGFTIRRLDEAEGFARAPVRPTDLEFDDQIQKHQSPPAEERLRHNLSMGITPPEGAEAFLRALSAGRAQLVISSLDLAGLKAQAEAGSISQQTEGQTFQRPDLDTDYVAPEGVIEEKLSQFWSTLLGVEKVGSDDNFFDLGGHSLIAVRLFAQVKKAFDVEFPISVLFEAPTIKKCAALIEAEGVHVAPSSDATDAETPRAPERRFTHLVPMHQGEGGPRRPFFLVAGMFGNVLNLRHLAHLLGTDRPFYGMQARGLYGNEAPHRSIPEAAKDYLNEIKQVQASGPYMLGGFSGGGIIALEIAQLLRAQGEDVMMLVMLDTPLPQRRPLELGDRALIQLQELKSGGILYPLKWLVRRVKWEFTKRFKSVPQDADISEVNFHNSDIETAFLEAVGQYKLQAWDGPLALFRPPLSGKWKVSNGAMVSSERSYVTPDNDWTEHAPLVQVIEVPGDHDSMVLEPNVRVLAARLRRCIEDAENPAARAARVSAMPQNAKEAS
ncbi:SDR family NAD(P)-dependent oxidoreductase [Lentibacter algarum]|uniref:type I polyketide synthase n=1 Tax=Lentibacter algarum TaxID=576131 RepID=UPI001C08BE0B|nr:type I polyketide synthase [Lentibacter algarum]MBU2983347.1 SDR family NAD(P)-dependent oxidoreductase [Lentibacter algarum]